MPRWNRLREELQSNIRSSQELRIDRHDDRACRHEERTNRWREHDAALAGCSDNGSVHESNKTLSGDDFPVVDEWLTETETGGEASNYDGSVVDQREEKAIYIDVGTGNNGTEFTPVAVAVTPGTTVRWEWTGDGGAHNVMAEPDHQIGESDYEFSSGDPMDEENEIYEQTLDDPGIALYHCDPHLSVGMKGAIIVE